MEGEVLVKPLNNGARGEVYATQASQEGCSWF